MNTITKRYSIRRFLTIFLLFSIVVSTIVSSYWVYRDAAHEVDELFDASLAQTARVLHGMITRENISANKQHLLDSLSNKDEDFERYTLEATPHGHKYEKKVSFQVWTPENELLLHSANVGEHALTPLERGFHAAVTETGHWRAFTLFSKQDNYWLIVGERDDIREELIHEIARDHMLPVLLCLPILGILIWLILGRGFRPLQRITQQLEAKDYETLSSIKDNQTPLEVDGLLNAINSLFGRLSASFKREQRFVSDAAHELRNPLAGVLIHTENMLEEINQGEGNQGGNKSHLAESVKHVKLSTQRLSHLVSQLLILSRADSEHFTKDDQEIDLALLAGEVCNDIHKPKQALLECDIELSKFKVSGNASLLEAMLRNLVDNAMRYSPEGSTVKVSCEADKGEVCLLVEDSGPGIPMEQRQAVLKRFYRADHSDDTTNASDDAMEGSGLGMAIVAQIADLHGAQLALGESGLGGVQVTVTFTA